MREILYACARIQLYLAQGCIFFREIIFFISPTIFAIIFLTHKFEGIFHF